MKALWIGLAVLLLAGILVFAQPPVVPKTPSMPSMGGEPLPNHAVAVLWPTAGNTARGTVTFDRAGLGVHIVAHLMGLVPGEHGIHIHEYGDCSAPDGASAGGHFAMAGEMHGAPADKMRHLGDLGNITAGADSTAALDVTDTMLMLGGVHSVIGRAVVVHAKADDLKTQPSGDSGPRIACGVIGWAGGK
jgi:superoxide dismutase, Cu-Zn family